MIGLEASDVSRLNSSAHSGFEFTLRGCDVTALRDLGFTSRGWELRTYSFVSDTKRFKTLSSLFVGFMRSGRARSFRSVIAFNQIADAPLAESSLPCLRPQGTLGHIQGNVLPMARMGQDFYRRIPPYVSGYSAELRR